MQGPVTKLKVIGWVPLFASVQGGVLKFFSDQSYQRPCAKDVPLKGATIEEDNSTGRPNVIHVTVSAKHVYFQTNDKAQWITALQSNSGVGMAPANPMQLTAGAPLPPPPIMGAPMGIPKVVPPTRPRKGNSDEALPFSPPGKGPVLRSEPFAYPTKPRSNSDPDDVSKTPYMAPSIPPKKVSGNPYMAQPQFPPPVLPPPQTPNPYLASRTPNLYLAKNSPNLNSPPNFNRPTSPGRADFSYTPNSAPVLPKEGREPNYAPRTAYQDPSYSARDPNVIPKSGIKSPGEISNGRIPPGPPTPQAIVSLPVGWEEVQTEDGRTYYWNVNTDTTSWERPASKVPPKVEAPQPQQQPQPQSARKRTANPAGPVLPKESDKLLDGIHLTEGGHDSISLPMNVVRM